jgi:hypothetical protein
MSDDTIHITKNGGITVNGKIKMWRAKNKQIINLTIRDTNDQQTTLVSLSPNKHGLLYTCLDMFVRETLRRDHA